MGRGDGRYNPQHRPALLLPLLVAVLLGVRVEVDGSTGAAAHSERAIERKLKQLNKPAVKTIHSEDGDVIDCIDVYKQPALDNPSLKDHVIRLPSKLEEEEAEKALFGLQTWHKSGSCPSGTIPVVRVTKDLLMKAPSLEDFGKKPYGKIEQKWIKLSGSKTATIAVTSNHSFAVIGSVGRYYVGASATFSVWNPRVEWDDEYSSAQIWLQSGFSEDFDSIETGWMVNPKLFGDRSTRLFIYWTSDAGKTSGCFNYLCEGFVQTNKEIGLGAALSQVSTIGGPLYDFSFALTQNTDTGDWILSLGGKVVGYFPSRLFDLLNNAAQMVQFGGDVYSTRVATSPHTGTAMGSGRLAEELRGNASYVYRPRVQDFTGALNYPPDAFALTLQPYCYSALNVTSGSWGSEPMFFFGGPGRHVWCP